jgi:hypothetical protein
MKSTTAYERHSAKRNRMNCEGCGELCVRKVPGDDSTWVHQRRDDTSVTWGECTDAPAHVRAAWPVNA